MTTAYPAALDNFSNPTPSTSMAASRSHSEQHSDLNDAIEAVQAKLGTDADAGAGEVAWSVLAALRERPSVRQFGAMGDDVTDDTAAFEAMSNAVKDGFVPAGNYRVHNASLASGAHLIFSKGAVLKPASAAAPRLMLRCDANSDITIENATIEIDNDTHPLFSPIWGQGCENVKVINCRVTGGNIGIHFVDCTDVIIEKCTATDCVQSGIAMQSTGGYSNIRGKILNCVSSCPDATEQGIQIQGGSDCQIRGNSVREAGIFGIQFNRCIASTMAGNTTFNTNREGCNISDSLYCNVDNNIVRWDGVAGADYGISLAAPNAQCSLNKITNNTVINSQKSGIAIAAVDGNQAAGNVVSNNIVYNPNILNEAWGAGILLYGDDVTGTVVQGNELYSGGTMKYGVHDWNAGTGKPLSTTIRNNRIVGAVTKNVNRNEASLPSIEANNGSPPTDYVPTVSREGAGAIVTKTINNATYHENDYRVRINLDITINDFTAPVTALTVTLPFEADGGTWQLVGRNTTTGDMLQATVADGSSTLRIFTFDNNGPIAADGNNIVVSGEYVRKAA